MKRAILILLTALAAVGCVGAQGLTLLMPTGITPPGSSAIVNVQLTNATGATVPQLTALQFTFTAPAEIGQVTMAAGPAAIAAGKSVSCNFQAPTVNGSSSICVVWGMNTTPISDGVIAVATLPVNATAKLTSETIGIALGQASDPNTVAVSMTSMGGSFPVFSQCDLNHDGVTDIADINVVVAQVIASISGAAAACTTGDLNGDKKCTVTDVYREVLAALPASAGPGAGVCRVGL